MGAPTDVLIRIDEIEIELRGLSTEVHEIRALVTQSAAAPDSGARAAGERPGPRARRASRSDCSCPSDRSGP